MIRKLITATVAASFVVLSLSACNNSSVAEGAYDSDKAVTSLSPNVDPRTPEQRYVSQLKDRGMSLKSEAQAINFGRTICQMYANGESEETVQNAVALIVSNSRTANGRGSEVDLIATRNFCPKYSHGN